MAIGCRMRGVSGQYTLVIFGMPQPRMAARTTFPREKSLASASQISATTTLRVGCGKKRLAVVIAPLALPLAASSSQR
jgi:hypothetical protein